MNINIEIIETIASAGPWAVSASGYPSRPVVRFNAPPGLPVDQMRKFAKALLTACDRAENLASVAQGMLDSQMSPR